MKFNWEEFKNKENKIAVHFNTEWERFDFVNNCEKNNVNVCKLSLEDELKEGNGVYLTNRKTWTTSEEWLRESGFTILEWSDYKESDITFVEVVEKLEKCFRKMGSEDGTCIGNSCIKCKFEDTIICDCRKLNAETANEYIETVLCVEKELFQPRKVTMQEVYEKFGEEVEIVNGEE